MALSTVDRYRGALLGLAAGDALGTTLEFSQPGSFEPLTDLIGGGPFRLEPGQWTDDTAMALCLAKSLGDDADTTGAIYGQLAGAHYGVEAIPARWRARLALRPRIEALADGLLALAETGRSATP